MTKNNVPHLLAYISGHGYGHVAQTAPVLNRLRQRLPGLRLTVCSTAPDAILRARIDGDFEHIDHAADFGMVMASALDVLADDSLAAYQAFHRDWTQRVGDEAARIAALAPDLVLTNAAYLPLAAAQQAGIASVTMCSLNWVDIFAHYCGHMPQAAEILQQMRAAYACASAFLRVTPGMPMDSFTNRRIIGAIAKLGKPRRTEINQKLGLKPHDKLVLLSLGGIATRLPMERWPQIAGVHWLVQEDWQVHRADSFNLESLGMEFSDALASCDAFICKPGYGSFAEAACNAIPTLYVRRDDWPEEPCLTTWLAEHGRCVEVSRNDLEAGILQQALQTLWAMPSRPLPQPAGIDEAADYLLRSISMASP